MRLLFCMIKKQKGLISLGCLVAAITTIVCIIISSNQAINVAQNENRVRNINERNIDEMQQSEDDMQMIIPELIEPPATIPHHNINQKVELLSEENSSEISTVPEKYCASYELNCSQLIVVSSVQSNADITMYLRDSDQQWHELLVTTGFVGVNGVGDAYEGSGMTPSGCYALSTAFGVNERPDTSLDYVQVDDTYYWVDDPESSYYNQFVSTDEVSSDNWGSAEHLVDYPEAYAYAVAIDYNTACTPYSGSAIFLHCSLNRPTLGCVSVDKSDMLFILAHISDDCHIIIE